MTDPNLPTPEEWQRYQQGYADGLAGRPENKSLSADPYYSLGYVNGSDAKTDARVWKELE